jgi:hypothetical protein
MAGRGIDVAARRSKHVDEFTGQHVDYASLPDPSGAGDTDEARYPAFQQLTAEFDTRIRFLLHLIVPADPDLSRP